MTPAEFEQRMREIYPATEDYDPEVAHHTADQLMCQLLRELGYGDGVEVFQEASKWYA